MFWKLNLPDNMSRTRTYTRIVIFFQGPPTTGRPAENPVQRPASNRAWQPRRTPEDTEVEGKIFQEYSIPKITASLEAT